jgi:hypothetical protein
MDSGIWRAFCQPPQIQFETNITNCKICICNYCCMKQSMFSWTYVTQITFYQPAMYHLVYGAVNSSWWIYIKLFFLLCILVSIYQYSKVSVLSHITWYFDHYVMSDSIQCASESNCFLYQIENTTCFCFGWPSSGVFMWNHKYSYITLFLNTYFKMDTFLVNIVTVSKIYSL